MGRETDLTPTLPSDVRALRHRTQAWTARKAKTTVKTLYRVERGEPTRTETLGAIADALDYPRAAYGILHERARLAAEADRARSLLDRAKEFK